MKKALKDVYNLAHKFLHKISQNDKYLINISIA